MYYYYDYDYRINKWYINLVIEKEQKGFGTRNA
jgi:hypothetical protein